MRSRYVYRYFTALDCDTSASESSDFMALYKSVIFNIKIFLQYSVSLSVHFNLYALFNHVIERYLLPAPTLISLFF